MSRLASRVWALTVLAASACGTSAPPADAAFGAGEIGAGGQLMNAGNASSGAAGAAAPVAGAPVTNDVGGAAEPASAGSDTAGGSTGSDKLGRAAGGASGSAGLAGQTGVAGAVASGPFPFKPDYILGADISWTLQDEAAGAKYADAAGVKPIEQIMVDNGFNFTRLRTFVNPAASGGYSPQGFCDTAHTITMAKRIKACGMGLFLDFHMSDTWASIGKQYVPSSWAGLSPSAMQKAAYDYVKDVMTKMVAAGVKPDMVQIGNETNSAMSGVSISNWADFSGLVNAGIKAVRETDPSIFIWAQHGQPRPEKGFAAWSDKYLAGNPNKIDVDGLCGSTYGTNNNGADWQESFGHVIDVYKRPVMSCEYTDVRRDLLNTVMRGFANKSGRGAFLWEPTRYPGVNDSTLFTKSGNTYTTNSAMAKYKALAQTWQLPVPSGACK